MEFETETDQCTVAICVFQLSKKYGPVFTVYLGPQRVVVLSGFKAVKEALLTNAEVFGERSAPKIAQIFVHNNGASNVLFE